MIRPLTGVCVVIALIAVLYTYQIKREVQLLDRQIEKTLRDTEALREQSRSLKAEWTLRENPERLRGFADQHLTLKPVLPSQFTTLAELGARLPQPVVTPAGGGPRDTTDEPETSQALASMTDPTASADEDLPIPPLPVPAPPVILAAASAAPPPIVPPAPVAERKPVAPNPPAAAPRPSVVPASQPAPPIQVRPAPPVQAQITPAQPLQAPPLQAQPVQARVQPVAAPAPQPVYSGSLLGMARGGVAAPTPRPMPVSASAWSNGN